MELALREAGKDTAALGLRCVSHHVEEKWELDLEILILMGWFLPLLPGCAAMQEMLARSHLLLRSLLASSPGIQGCPESDLGAPMIQKEQNRVKFSPASRCTVHAKSKACLYPKWL